jgi:alanine racemase
MDLTSIDVTDYPELKPGDDVVILDDDPTSAISAAAIARRTGTIPYEVLTSIGPRVERTYFPP